MNLSHLKEEDLIQLAKEDLFTFVALTWQKAGGRKDFVAGWHVEAICEHLEALYYLDIRNLGISISPRKGKSLICSTIAPVWFWLQDAKHRVLNSSYAEALALRDAKRSRNLVQMQWFQERWGNLVKIDPKETGAGYYCTTEGGYRIATSVEGQSTGKGSDTQIIDDPHKALEKNSHLMLEKAWLWFTETMANRYEDEKTFRRLVIHQRVAENDVMGRIKAEEPEYWCFLELPEEYIPTTYVTDIGWSDPRKYKGELLCEELFSREMADKYKKRPSLWASQYQQDPKPEGGNLVKEDFLLWFDSYLLLNQTEIGGVDMVYTSWDLAEKDGEDNDYTVGQLWVILGDKKFLVDQVRGQWDFLERIRQFEELNARAGIWERRSRNGLLHLVEDRSSGSGFVNTLEKVKGHQKLVLVKKNKSKLECLNESLIEFDMRKVYVNNGHFKKEWLDEITAFPKGSYDDQVDATTQVLLYNRDNAIVVREIGDYLVQEKKEIKETLDVLFERDTMNVVRVSKVLKLFED